MNNNFLSKKIKIFHCWLFAGEKTNMREFQSKIYSKKQFFLTGLIQVNPFWTTPLNLYSSQRKLLFDQDCEVSLT